MKPHAQFRPCQVRRDFLLTHAWSQLFHPAQVEKTALHSDPPARSWPPHSAPRAHRCVGILLGAPSARAAWVARNTLKNTLKNFEFACFFQCSQWRSETHSQGPPSRRAPCPPTPDSGPPRAPRGDKSPLRRAWAPRAGPTAAGGGGAAKGAPRAPAPAGRPRPYAHAGGQLPPSQRLPPRRARPRQSTPPRARGNARPRQGARAARGPPPAAASVAIFGCRHSALDRATGGSARRWDTFWD